MFTTTKPFVIAGPCSAESEQQVLLTAQALAQQGIPLFRAGVWKPRTRPGSFEGNGIQALAWLQTAQKEYNIGFITEVAEPEHIEAALKYGASALWIGARTTVNPFQIQHLADALKGVDIPVLVKNPVNPDVDLWIGAIERFEKAGITDLGAIHRGFSGYRAATGYRNQPNWPIPIELKRRLPSLPILCDPSHISGKRDKIAQIAQKALDMRFDGLMIEVHPNPDAALTDAAQQITPETLQELLVGLIVREEFTTDMTKQVELEYIRQQIDALDAEIIDLIAKRLELSNHIGTVKKACNMTAYQPARWREIVEITAERARLHQLNPDFIIELYEKIHDQSIKQQLTILGNAPKQIKS